MGGAEFALDLLLATSLVVLALVLLTSESFLRTALLFIVFGVCMALAWVRLLAPDIALAEAAIGAGITGVLLLDAIRHLEWEKQVLGGDSPGHWQSRPSALHQAGLIGAMLVVAGLLLAGVWAMADRRPGMAAEVAGAMEKLEHPVTAVLLVFRGFDTWLEMGILLLAVLAMLAARSRQDLDATLLAPPRDRILEGIVRVLTPLAVLTAGYFLWQGTSAPGGAFQSGVILGAAGILLWLSGHRSIDSLPDRLWKLLIVCGFAGFTLTALVTLVMSGRMLQYPEPPVLWLLEAIELVAAVAIGACLAALFVGQHPGQEMSGQQRASAGRGREAP
jgi:multisubunit Na+/H+ antiporter MnhB subunit